MNKYKIYMFIVIFIKIENRNTYVDTSNLCSSCISWFLYSTFEIEICVYSVYNVHGPVIVCLWQNFIRLHDFYDSQVITKLQQRAYNTQQSLTNFAMAIPTFRSFMRTYLWQRFESSMISFWGYLSIFRSVLLSQHCWGNHSQGLVPPTCQLSIDTYLASTSPSACTIKSVYDKMGIYNSTGLTIGGIP